MRIVLSLIAVSCLAACAPRAEAADTGFTYRKKPVDPVCVQTLLGMGDLEVRSVDLKACGPGERKLAPGDRFRPDEDGWIGFEETEDGGMGNPYFQYKTHGRLADGSVLIETMESGGGTGVFTGVSAVTLEDGRISFVKSFAGGDRCNGGIAEAEVEDGKAVYAYNATPADIVNRFLGEERYEPYKDLESSATSCVAEVEEADGAIAAVILDKGTLAAPEADDEWVRQYPYQKCFNDVMASYAAVESHPARLSPEEATALVKMFDARCGKGKAAHGEEKTHAAP